jgi:flagellar P-ring protein FlgI
VVMPEGTSIEELVRALNALGTLPRDIIVILTNLKAVGALHGSIIKR